MMLGFGGPFVLGVIVDVVCCFGCGLGFWFWLWFGFGCIVVLVVIRVVVFVS